MDGNTEFKNEKQWYEHDIIEFIFGPSVSKKALWAEFIGVFLFQFLGASASSNAVDSGLTTAALGNGCALAMIIYATVHISGAHLNPAVSTALFVIGEQAMNAPKYCAYILAQYFGALLGAMVLRFLCPDTAVVRNPFVTQGILSEGVSRNLAALGIFEFILTFTLVFVICAVLLDSKGIAKQYAALAVGLVYAVGIYCEGPYTGGSMNPARTVAAALVYWDFTGMWIALVFLHGGAITGAWLYKQAFSINKNVLPRNSPAPKESVRYI